MKSYVEIDGIGMDIETKITHDNDDLSIEIEGTYKLDDSTSKLVANVGSLSGQPNKVRVKIDEYNIDQELYIGDIYYHFTEESLHFKGTFGSDYRLL